MEIKKKKMSVEEAYKRLSYLCAGAEYCEADMRKKMRGWELPEGGEAEVLKRLKSDKFIDEIRYAHAFVRDKYRYNRWGKVRIGRELRMKGIDPVIIEDALEEVDEGEYEETLCGLIESKRRTVKGKSEYDIKMKLVRFAVSKGYSLDEAMKCVNVDYTDGYID